MTTITFNPVTQKPIGDAVTRDKLNSQPAAKHVVDDLTGFKPMADRQNGTTKVVCYHIANLLTAGLVGAIAGNIANSTQIMGSGKTGEKNWLRDLGETHLNATVARHTDPSKDSKFGKAISVLANGWGWMGGVIWGGGALNVTRQGLDLHQNYKKREAFKQEFRQQFGRPPSPELLKNTNTSKLLSRAAHGSRHAKQIAKQDMDRLTATNTGQKKALTYNMVENGSEALKACFSDHLEKEFSSELLLFRDWAQDATKDIQPNKNFDRKDLTSDNANYRLSKFDMINGYNQLIKQGSKFENNVSYANRVNWANLMDPNVQFRNADDDVQAFRNEVADFRQRYNAKVDQHKALQNALAKTEPKTPKFYSLRRQMKRLQQEMNQMQQEKFSPAHSKMIGRPLADTVEQTHALLGHSAIRFGNSYFSD